MGWVARYASSSCVVLLRAMLLSNIVSALEEQTDFVVILAAFHALQWLLSGGKSIWLEDEEESEVLFGGEVWSVSQ